jgi:hypothetical protein
VDDDNRPRFGELWSEILFYLFSGFHWGSPLSGKPPSMQVFLPINAAMLTCSEQHLVLTG